LSGYSADGLASFLNGNLAFQTFLADTSRNPSGDLLLVPYDTGRVQQSATILEGGGMNHWSFGGAVEIAKDVMVGMSLNFVSGTYTYDRQFTEQDVQNVYNAVIPYDFNKLIYESTISSDLSGFNALFGLMLKKQGRYQIGLAVRTPTHFDINETYSDNMQSFFKTNSESYQQTFTNETKYSITTPFVFSGGVSVQALDWLVLAGDAEYTDWTQMQFNTSDPALLNENHFITTGMKATWNLRGGGEITFWSLGLRLRGGIIMNPSPYVGDPSKYDQMYYTAGVGYDLDNNVTLNGAFALGTWSTFRTNYSYLLPNNNTNSSATSNENVKSSSVVVSLSYRF
jgi:long-subunit fatty acid transport protein